jgi:hypothetical protein
MPRRQPDERDLADLTVEELEAEEAIILPDREALSLINPHLVTPASPAIIIPAQPGDSAHGTDLHELTPPHQESQHEH